MTEVATSAYVRYGPDGVPEVEASLHLTGSSWIRCHIYPEHAPILSVTDAHVSVSVSVPEPGQVTDQDVAVARELAGARSPGTWPSWNAARPPAVTAHLLGRAPSGLLPVLRGGKGLPGGSSETSPCRPGGSGVGLCLPGRGDDPGSVPPISEGGPGVRGRRPRNEPTALQMVTVPASSRIRASETPALRPGDGSHPTCVPRGRCRGDKVLGG